MAPVVTALRATPGLDVLTLVTGQHREQLAGSLATFGLTPDADLAVMTPRQSLAELTGRIVPAAARTLKELRADYVLVHGDTSTTFCVALAAFLEGIPVAHVEAGLRSFDMAQPFPEEANRRLTDVLTDLDLPPTPLAKRHLLMEGKREAAMVVTGNTAVDAVQQMRRHARLPERVPGGRLVAVTMHRRENLPVMRELAAALAAVARANPDVTFVYPVHLNPAVREAAVVGIPHPEWGEEVVAYVALVPDAQITAEELDAFCKDRLARFKCPKTFHIIPELPKGPTGKVLKRELRAMATTKDSVGWAAS